MVLSPSESTSVASTLAFGVEHDGKGKRRGYKGYFDDGGEPIWPEYVNAATQTDAPLNERSGVGLEVVRRTRWDV